MNMLRRKLHGVGAVYPPSEIITIDSVRSMIVIRTLVNGRRDANEPN
jgi:hypothetical protein